MAGFYHSMLGSMGCTSSVGRFQRPVEREQPARFRRRRSRACWAETANSTPKSAPPTTSHGPCNYRPDRIAVAALGCRSCEKRRWEAPVRYFGQRTSARSYGAVGRERCEGVIHFVEDGNVKVAEVAWPWHKVGHDLALAFASQLVTTGEKPSRMRSRRRCRQAGAVRQGFATVAI